MEIGRGFFLPFYSRQSFHNYAASQFMVLSFSSKLNSNRTMDEPLVLCILESLSLITYFNSSAACLQFLQYESI